MKRSHPRAIYHADPDELFRVLFSPRINFAAALTDLQIEQQQLDRWRDGSETLPRYVFAYLQKCLELHTTELGSQFGPWSGWKLSKRGDGLENPFRPGCILYVDDARQIETYRRANTLTGQQAELIERLLVERDFYQRQCTREARFGLMLNRLFWRPSLD